MPPCRTDKSKIQQIVYGGFTNCLYSTQRFQADTERKLAVIFDRDAQRCFKPLKDQFQIFYRLGVNQCQYVPDFVVETTDAIWMLEGSVNKVTMAVVLDGMDLTDAQWAVLEPTCRPRRRPDGRGCPWSDPRAVLNGVLWVLRTGAAWHDRGYDSDALDRRLRDQYGIEMIARHRRGRLTPTQDGRPLRRTCRRWKIERLFAWLHNSRRLVTRWEYHVENFLGMVQLACDESCLGIYEMPSSRFGQVLSESSV